MSSALAEQERTRKRLIHFTVMSPHVNDWFSTWLTSFPPVNVVKADDGNLVGNAMIGVNSFESNGSSRAEDFGFFIFG